MKLFLEFQWVSLIQTFCKWICKGHNPQVGKSCSGLVRKFHTSNPLSPCLGKKSLSPVLGNQFQRLSNISLPSFCHFNSAAVHKVLQSLYGVNSYRCLDMKFTNAEICGILEFSLLAANTQKKFSVRWIVFRWIVLYLVLPQINGFEDSEPEKTKPWIYQPAQYLW